MSDIIQLLPDAVANQIAAGEVVQRPASAVKEMIENAIDSGADTIKVIIKDAGKSLIQVIDNGCGMSPTDARISFERHATSKIKKAEDLFAIRTMGFRGEAMASIAAIAQVELKSRRTEDELGTRIRIEGSKVEEQEPEAMSAGTSIAVKNLFYNIPARRNFLKSNSVEMRHIIDEFQRVALAHPNIFFSLYNEGKEVYHLEKAGLKQRIVHLFGNSYNQRLVPVEEETTIINVAGYVGKPEFSRKTRGEQFFFVNKRYIRDPYLHHAVMNAYSDILPADSYPLYILYIDIDTTKIDINVHPTKTEIKYDDDKAVYAIIQSAVKRALGRYNVTPTLDFNQETGFSNMITIKPLEEITPPSISFNPDFNPFDTQETNSTKHFGKGNLGYEPTSAIPRNWDTLYQITEQEETIQSQILHERDEEETTPEGAITHEKTFFQLHNRYIITQIHSGLIMIHQQRAHERILYEQFKQQLDANKGLSQQSLFPQTIELSAADASLLESILPEIKSLGFQVRPFGKTTYIIDGLPADLDSNINEVEVIEHILEDFKNNQTALKINKRDGLAKSLARNAALKTGTQLDNASMAELIDKLFACESPNVSLNGRPTIITQSLEDLALRFDKI